MKKGISTFQIGVFVACGIGAFLALLIFSGKIPLGDKSSQAITGSVTMWGTIPYVDMLNVVEVINKTYKDVKISYKEKKPETFQTELIEALASGVGPDLITVTSSDIIKNSGKFITIPYTSLPESVFRATFIDQGSQFANDTGVLAFPLMVNPMVMFYNKDMLTSSFTVQPPQTWDEVTLLNKKVTQKNDAGVLATQTAALGTFDNITHAKELITMLIFQGGNSIIKWDSMQKKYVSVFSQSFTSGVSPVEGALTFYTSFANPLDEEHYSWNPTLPMDRDQFIAGKLALYFGYTSEIQRIRDRNPNLNFQVAMMPQRSSVPTKVTYGELTGVAIMKMSKNPQLAVLVAQAMVGKDAMTALVTSNPSFAPARLDMLSGNKEDGLQTLVYNSAIISKSFLDPDKQETSAFFKKVIDQVNSGLARPVEIISSGSSLLQGILTKIQK